MAKIKLHSAAIPEIILIGSEDLEDIRTSNDSEVDPQKEIVLFPDQLKSLKELFWLKDTLAYLK